MGFETTFLGLPALLLICGLLLVFKDGHKKPNPLDTAVFTGLLPICGFALWAFTNANADIGIVGGVGMILFTLAAPFLLLFMLFWVPFRLLSGLFSKRK